MSLILLGVCAIAAGSLSFVYSLTKEKIAEQAEAEKLDALKDVMPEATKFEEAVPGIKWIAYKGDKQIGIAIEASIQGYGGPIRIIFGVGADGKITKVRIIEQTETPGLGAKIREAKFLGQFEGLLGADAALKKDDALNGKIDSISGATISSRAVAAAVQKGLRDAVGAQPETEAFKDVMPWAGEFRELASGDPGVKIWSAYDGGKKVGTIIKTGAKGYSGPIMFIFGLSEKKKITGIKIIKHSETVSVGAYIEGPEFLWQFQNKGGNEIALKADDQKNGKIDAVSGATASARSITQAIRDAINLIK
jgi:electron transport complex protein RnfG